MKQLLCATIIVVMALPVIGCGNKGKLKSPAQIEHEHLEKEREAAKKAKERAEEKKAFMQEQTEELENKE